MTQENILFCCSNTVQLFLKKLSIKKVAANELLIDQYLNTLQFGILYKHFKFFIFIILLYILLWECWFMSLLKLAYF